VNRLISRLRFPLSSGEGGASGVIFYSRRPSEGAHRSKVHPHLLGLVPVCLMLYLAAASDVPMIDTPQLTVEEVEAERSVVRQWLSLPAVRFVGAHTGCSCGFPSVAAETPVEYHEGMFDSAEDRTDDLASVRALLDLVATTLVSNPTVELLAVWAGDEWEPPVGTIDVQFREIEAEKFFFTEHFLYRISV